MAVCTVRLMYTINVDILQCYYLVLFSNDKSNPFTFDVIHMFSLDTCTCTCM